MGFREEWRQDLNIELASIEPMRDAHMILARLRAVGFRIALASNLAPAYVEPALRILGGHMDVTCFSCDPDVQAVKPEHAFFAALRARLDFRVNLDGAKVVSSLKTCIDINVFAQGPKANMDEVCSLGGHGLRRNPSRPSRNDEGCRVVCRSSCGIDDRCKPFTTWQDHTLQPTKIPFRCNHHIIQAGCFSQRTPWNLVTLYK